jgi:cysteinyl-tRNA synthetase
MTQIQLYNTRTRRKEPFEPLDPDNVRIYVCGPTVYDRAHIGNARPVVVFDVLFRLMRHVYGADHVTYVRNFTDVDDKINARAAETGRSIRQITDETIGWYHEDMDALGALRPTHEPRATEHIGDMIAMIEALIASGHAYAAEGHVLFDVGTYPDYGKLARRSLDEMQAGARVEVAPYKKNPMDFVLWKPSTPEQPGWDSPWGRGRPGWHIECSAMSDALLWKKPFREGKLSTDAQKHPHVFDIHGGGIDLQFPHHENEVAQSRCANHTQVMAQVWMHNGFLQVEGEKMAKSLGNFFTVKDLRGKISGNVIRHVLMSTHYRAPLDWTESRVEEAKSILNRWLRLNDRFRRAGMVLSETPTPDPLVIDALADDLNTSQALKRVQELAWASNVETDKVALAAVIETIAFLGFKLSASTGQDVSVSVEDAVAQIERAETFLNRKADELHAARMARDFAKADALRAEMESLGVKVLSSKEGTTWTRTVDFDPAKLEAL